MKSQKAKQPEQVRPRTARQCDPLLAAYTEACELMQACKYNGGVRTCRPMPAISAEQLRQIGTLCESLGYDVQLGGLGDGYPLSLAVAAKK